MKRQQIFPSAKDESCDIILGSAAKAGRAGTWKYGRKFQTHSLGNEFLKKTEYSNLTPLITDFEDQSMLVATVSRIGLTALL